MVRFVFLMVGALGGCASISNVHEVESNAEIYHISSAIFANTVLIPNSKIEDVHLYLVFPSGEAANPFDEGLAHYVEHLAWLSAFADSQNEKGRYSNALTNHFSTLYKLKTAEDDLQNALQTLISVSTPLSVDADFAQEERNIILREYDHRRIERLLYPVLRDMDRVLYGKGTLARSVIGKPSIISEYSVESAKALHKQSHILSEATLLIYGNVSKHRIETVLASIPTAEIPDLVKTPILNSWVENVVIKDTAYVPLPKLSENTFLYRKIVSLPPCDVFEYCAMVAKIAGSVLNSALPGGLAGPLTFDHFIARSLFFDTWLIGKEYIEVSFRAHPGYGISLEEVERTFQRAFRATLENGLTNETFERILSRIEGNLTNILDSDRPGYNLDLVLGRLMSAQQIASLSEQIDALESVRLEDVNQFLKSLLSDGREVTRLVSSNKEVLQ